VHDFLDQFIIIKLLNDSKVYHLFTSLSLDSTLTTLKLVHVFKLSVPKTNFDTILPSGPRPLNYPRLLIFSNKNSVV